jgi:hypothetical protein
MYEIPDISALLRNYEDQTKRIKGILDDYKNTRQQLLQQLSRNPEHEFYTDFANFSKKLAKEGWTIPLSLQPGELYDLLDLYETESYDQAFLKLYTDNNGELFNILTDNLSRSKSYSKWRSLIIQCIKAYNTGDYHITIPSLFSILEGVINEYFDSTKVNLNVITLCKNQTEKAPDNRIVKIIWISILTFVEHAFQRAPFNEDRPDFINRHWILHGRDVTNWTTADSLRLFNALNTIQCVLP